MDPSWLTAIATIIYTVGTFLLWWTTGNSLKAMRQSLELTRDAVKLNFLQAYREAEREIERIHESGWLQKSSAEQRYQELLEKVFPQFQALLKKEPE